MARTVSARRAISIRPMQDTDRPFVYRGLSDTNWQDIPEDQKTELDRTACERARIYIKGKGGVRIEHHVLAKKYDYEILDKYPQSQVPALKS